MPPSSPQSIKIDYQFPGVYLCKANGSCYFTSRSFSEFPSDIKRDYEDNITYVKFKNAYAYDSLLTLTQCSEKQGTYFTEQKTCGYAILKFGAILHEGRNYTLACDVFTADKDVVLPKVKDGGVSSVTVFIQPNEPPDPVTGGVTLYKLENFTEEQMSGGTAKKVFWPQDKPAQGNYNDLSKYNYEDNEDVEDSVLSLKIEGNYMALLFRNKNFQHKCEVISANDFNLGVDNPVGDEVSSLKVIPAQK